MKKPNLNSPFEGAAPASAPEPEPPRNPSRPGGLARARVSAPEGQASPFPGISPHLYSPRARVRTWFIEPAGMFNKTDAGTQINATVATYISEQVYNLMRARFPLASRYLYIHDFSESAGYDTQGRQILSQWALRVRSQIENVIVITPPTNSIFHMGLDTVALLLRMSGIPFEIAANMEEVRARHPIKPSNDNVP